MPHRCAKSAADCVHKHVKVSKEEAAKLYKPPGAGNGTGDRQQSPAKDPKAPPNPPKGTPWCRRFLTSAGCNDTACMHAHLDEAVVKQIKDKAAERAAAKSKGKGKG
eukprot:13257615-Heterocapsa_arctica.AAC.1